MGGGQGGVLKGIHPASPTSFPPKGATKLQRYYPLEIGIRLWGFCSPEPGRVTAFRDTPPRRANRRSFVYILGPATVGQTQTRAFCPEYMGTCMGPRACQARRHASRVLSLPCVCTQPLSWQEVHGKGSRTKGRQDGRRAGGNVQAVGVDSHPARSRKTQPHTTPLTLPLCRCLLHRSGCTRLSIREYARLVTRS